MLYAPPALLTVAVLWTKFLLLCFAHASLSPATPKSIILSSLTKPSKDDSVRSTRAYRRGRNSLHVGPEPANLSILDFDCVIGHAVYFLERVLEALFSIITVFTLFLYWVGVSITQFLWDHCPRCLSATSQSPPSPGWFDVVNISDAEKRRARSVLCNYCGEHPRLTEEEIYTRLPYFNPRPKEYQTPFAAGEHAAKVACISLVSAGPSIPF